MYVLCAFTGWKPATYIYLQGLWPTKCSLGHTWPVLILSVLFVTTQFGNSADPDQMLCSEASDLGLLCLPVLVIVVVMPKVLLPLLFLWIFCKQLASWLEMTSGLHFSALMCELHVRYLPFGIHRDYIFSCYTQTLTCGRSGA